MSKDKSEVRTDGRAVFYTVLYKSFREAALECGYALAVHGSMISDMDLIAVPWVNDAKTPDELAKAISDCIDATVWKDHHLMDRHEKPHGRVTYTISIYSDWHIDLSVIPLGKPSGFQMRIVDETAQDMATAIGISESRRVYLSQQMDDISRGNSNQAVRSCNLFNDILFACQSIEEVVYCVHVHTSWLLQRGIMPFVN
jgi:hypothetical protein